MKKALILAACVAVVAGVVPRACAQFGPYGQPRSPLPGGPGWGPPGLNPGGRFGPAYGPRPGGLNGLDGLGVSGGQGPFGLQPGTRGVPGMHDPHRGLPPAARKLLDTARPGRTTVGHRFGPLAGNDPLAPFRLSGGGNPVSPVSPGVRFGPGVPPIQGPPPIDPKLFVNLPPTSLLKDFEVKPPAPAGAGEPPAWLRWEYAVGVLLAAALAGVLHGRFGRKESAR